MSHISAATARALVAEIRTAIDGARGSLATLYDGQGWIALGYDSWDELCDTELGARIALPRAERKELVAEMTKAGMPTRAIGKALGVNHATVARDLAPVANATPEPLVAAIALDPETGEITEPEPVEPLPPIQGRDGKTYTRPPLTPRQRDALAEIMTPDPNIEYRLNLLRAIEKAQPLMRFEPARIVEVADENTRFLIEAFASDTAKWAAAIKSSGHGLRVVKG